VRSAEEVSMPRILVLLLLALGVVTAQLKLRNFIP